MCKLKTCLIAKPPFTKPPFVNSRRFVVALSGSLPLQKTLENTGREGRLAIGQGRFSACFRGLLEKMLLELSRQVHMEACPNRLSGNKLLRGARLGLWVGSHCRRQARRPCPALDSVAGLPPRPPGGDYEIPLLRHPEQLRPQTNYGVGDMPWRSTPRSVPRSNTLFRALGEGMERPWRVTTRPLKWHATHTYTYIYIYIYIHRERDNYTHYIILYERYFLSISFI